MRKPPPGLCSVLRAAVRNTPAASASFAVVESLFTPFAQQRVTLDVNKNQTVPKLYYL